MGETVFSPTAPALYTSFEIHPQAETTHKLFEQKYVYNSQCVISVFSPSACSPENIKKKVKVHKTNIELKPSLVYITFRYKVLTLAVDKLILVPI